MTAELPHFLAAMTYPYAASPGKTDTSRAAAPKGPQAATLQREVMRLLRQGPMTADECAADLGESILAIRPRFSELKKQGRIVDTGLRRRNATSGHSAIVWRVDNGITHHIAV